ncbi:putative G-patch domain-containing protein [Seiridium cardinale]|uniref:PinX1-related protein 1 n=1 Tax=Seiridium cardinale TaxID=138064 RepID=A0ABR2XPK8_9PEZI
MGLAGKKDKRKLNEDPNNTKWSRDATTFGQKILRSHGWEPGQYLGAQDASHASMHSAASSAPIKITLKDDNLGLGAKVRQKQGDECTGLDVFKDLLGRLNGETDDTIAKKQAVRSELKTSLWVERRYGPMRFVKGGLLVGDQITELLKQASEAKSPVAEVSGDAASALAEECDETAESKLGKKEKKSKKRKAEESDCLADAETDDAQDKKKKKKRSKDGTAVEAGQDLATSDSERKRRKKEKKEKKAREAREETTDADADADAETKSKSKKDKKDKKRKAKQANDTGDETKDHNKEDLESSKRKKKRKNLEASEAAESPKTVVITSVADSGTSTPTGTGTSTPQPMSRHMVRSRNIASKRMAMADMTALKQIFMVKPV